MGKRISRGTPYVLTQQDLEAALLALTPRTEAAVAALFNMSDGEWRAQPDRVKVKQLLDFQASGQLAATLAAAAKAQGDLEEVAFPTINRSDEDLQAAVELLVEQALEKRATAGAGRKGAGK